MQGPILGAGAAAAMAAIAMLRLAWGLEQRSLRLNACAWGLLLAGSAAGMAACGAWGLAVTWLAAMSMATVLLGHAALTAPHGKGNASKRRAHLLPDRGEPLHLGRRIVTFLMTVPLALLAALLIALAARISSKWAGWSDANANTLCMFLLPLLWAALAFILLMRPQRRQQVKLLVGPALASAAILWLETLA